MGTFLAISSVAGKTKNEVAGCLENYALSVNGGFQEAANITSDTPNSCIIDEQSGNTSVFYPDGYLEWDESSKFISKELDATVFAFHIHDGDLWMYVLYKSGEVVDRFNPIPDYWDNDLSEEDIDSWRGSAETIARLIPYVKPEDIDRYLLRWNLEEEPTKAYPTDEFTREDWQMVDFMSKLKLPYPLDDNGNPKGHTYKLWTNQLPLASQSKMDFTEETTDKKPWWKFW